MIARSTFSRIVSKHSGVFLRRAELPKLAARCVHVEKRLEELGITLPPPSAPKANYDICCRAAGGMLYVSGHLPITLEGSLMTGKIGPQADGGKSVEHGYEAARRTGLAIVATLREQLGDLDRVQQIVKVRTVGSIIGKQPVL
jgi:enamine deaminase RidA (YjgF/YER057c/UK114 family)